MTSSVACCQDDNYYCCVISTMATKPIAERGMGRGDMHISGHHNGLIYLNCRWCFIKP